MLSTADVQELTWWFGAPEPVYAAGRLAAQTYEPRSSGSYDPTTDMRLENLVGAALKSNNSEWARVKRVFEALTAKHREVLRRAFGPLPPFAVAGFRFPEVAIGTDPAIARGLEVAMHDEHMRLLEVARLDAMRDGLSPMSVAGRVLEADRRIEAAGIVVPDDVVRSTIHRELARAVKNDDTELLVPVRLEMQRLVDEAGDAYRAARGDLGATRRADKAAKRKAAQDYLDEQLGKKRRKEADRFEQKLKAAS